MFLSKDYRAGYPGRKTIFFNAPGVLLFIFILFGAAGCSTAAAPHAGTGGRGGGPGKIKPYKVLGRWYRPVADSSGFSQEGIASWYGRKFHGRKTANGETYNMYAMTAAHKTLPLGTRVRVKNLANGRETEVRVNDRGPFVRGRIIDLSKKAAGKLGVLGPGTAPVKIWAVGSPPKAAVPSPKAPGDPSTKAEPADYTRGIFTVQVAAYQNYDNAVKLREKLEREYGFAVITTYHRGASTFYRVRVGRFDRLGLARKFAKRLWKNGHAGAFTVAE